MVMFIGLKFHVFFGNLVGTSPERGCTGVKYWRKPLDADTVKSPRGLIFVIREQCKGCGFCVEYCPRDVLELSQEFNKKGYHPPVAVNEEACVSCGLCELICPEFAIYTELVEEEQEKSETTEKSEV
jgi:2-oxoglutarate ferredoxin oxidoreductase subunit delta